MEVRVRKVLFFMLVSLDGFYAGPGNDITWHHVDEPTRRLVHLGVNITGVVVATLVA